MYTFTPPRFLQGSVFILRHWQVGVHCYILPLIMAVEVSHLHCGQASFPPPPSSPACALVENGMVERYRSIPVIAERQVLQADFPPLALTLMSLGTESET